MTKAPAGLHPVLDATAILIDNGATAATTHLLASMDDWEEVSYMIRRDVEQALKHADGPVGIVVVAAKKE